MDFNWSWRQKLVLEEKDWVLWLSLEGGNLCDKLQTFLESLEYLQVGPDQKFMVSQHGEVQETHN